VYPRALDPEIKREKLQGPEKKDSSDDAGPSHYRLWTPLRAVSLYPNQEENKRYSNREESSATSLGGFREVRPALRKGQADRGRRNVFWTARQRQENSKEKEGG